MSSLFEWVIKREREIVVDVKRQNKELIEDGQTEGESEEDQRAGAWSELVKKIRGKQE